MILLLQPVSLRSRFDFHHSIYSILNDLTSKSASIRCIMRLQVESEVIRSYMRFILMLFNFQLVLTKLKFNVEKFFYLISSNV